MTRHIADHPTPEDRIEDGGLRLRHFLRLAREEERHPTARRLHRHRPAAPAEGRLRPLLRVLRQLG
jgi:hypothetical protein